MTSLLAMLFQDRELAMRNTLGANCPSSTSHDSTRGTNSNHKNSSEKDNSRPRRRRGPNARKTIIIWRRTTAQIQNRHETQRVPTIAVDAHGRHIRDAIVVVVAIFTLVRAIAVPSGCISSDEAA